MGSNPHIYSTAIVEAMEKKILNIQDEKVKIQLIKLLMLKVPNNQGRDWNELKTAYSYSDKTNLCKLWSKYGHYHPNDFVYVIHQMHIHKLMPEVIVPFYQCVFSLKQDGDNKFEYFLNNERSKKLVNEIITKAFFDFNDIIKDDVELLEAYENSLTILAHSGDEVAAVILDEFRIH